MHGKSQKQKDQFKNVQSLRHPKNQVFIIPIEIDPVRYCLASLSEGLGESQSRRFLAKLNIPPPSSSAFYAAQRKLNDIITEYLNALLAMIRENLSQDTIFGVDCSWSARRNASHAIVIFMDVRSKLIFDYVIVSRNPQVSDIEFHDSSNMMEVAAIKSKREQYIRNYKYVGFCHDFDLDTSPSLQPDDETGLLIEYLDPGHLKKVLDNIFNSYNNDNHLFNLKENIMMRFNYIVRNKKLTVDEKVTLWHQTPQWIINNCKSKGYLVNITKRKRRISPSTAENTLKDFLNASEWLVRKCCVADTQAIESYNAVKARICPKNFAFQISFRIRCMMAILQWNDKDWYLLIDDKIIYKKLNFMCRNIIFQDSKKKKKLQEQAQNVLFRIIRNTKRRNKRIQNKININGHQYAEDLKNDKKKVTLL